MPRKKATHLELRKQAEAAEAAGIEDEKSPKKKAKKKKAKKKAAKKRTTRRVKDAIPERKRLVWVIFTATLREEARFPYDQRKEAEKKLEQLLAKGKRTYFLQPVKELVSGEAIVKPPEEVDEEETKASKTAENSEEDAEDSEEESEEE